ncbi:AAA domain-containing protein [Pseudomonas asiatica]|uniref:AAA domain-containing protein n=1 Tax=Pseudomonas TaxID=286 RepID=UPI003878218B
MKIINHGHGIHEREVPGIDYLKNNLPDDWVAHTNLDLSLSNGAREIDVILFASDRIILIDLKDGHGRYESVDGDWSHNGHSQGRSPVKKILDNAKQVMILLSSFLDEHAKRTKYTRLPTPRVEGVVVLSSSNDLSGIAPTEVGHVFTLKDFASTVSDTRKRLKRFPEAHHSFYKRPLSSDEWRPKLQKFFNVRDGHFREGMRRYGGYVATDSRSWTYRHQAGIYSEFNVVDDNAAQSAGLLRRWDFSEADTRFQTEDGRREIAGRERSVISWLNDRSTDCEAAVLQPKAEDITQGVDYWEVYEKRRKMKRLSEFVTSELPALRPNERMELVRQLLAQTQVLHSYEAAHLDLGPHSVWVELPSVVRLSHLMSARYPEANSLGNSRYQFLSSVKTPEDILEAPSIPPQKDVYHLGCLMHLFLFGAYPESRDTDPPEWNPDIDADGTYKQVHEVLARALSWDASERFKNAIEMLDCFNALSRNQNSGVTVLKRLDAFKTVGSQMQLIRLYPFTRELKQDNYVEMWVSDKDEQRLVVKVWKRATWSDGSSDHPKILDFLERARELASSPPPNCVPIKDAIWLQDAIVIIQLYFDAPNLSEHALSCARSDVTPDAVLTFLLSLARAVIAMHDSGVAHGDLKPSNILVSKEPFEPHFVDYHDFSCVADGEIQTSAYAPMKGGRYERDRFAVTVIANELIEGLDVPAETLHRIRQAIDTCRGEVPENATLLPLQDALEEVLAPKTQNATRRLTIALSNFKSQEVLSDEGVFGYGFDKGQFYLRGATKTIYFMVNNKKITSAKLVEMPHLLNGSLSRRQIGTIAIEVEVLGEITNSYTDFQSLFDEAPFAELLKSNTPGESTEVEEQDDQDLDDSEELLTQAETNEDAITELVESEQHRSFASVPQLWRTLVDVEKDLTIEAVASGPSSYRKETKLHAIPIELECGSFEFSRNDKVFVERMGARGWQKIGILDVSSSSDKFILVDAMGWMPAGGSLVEIDQRLRFQSQMEQANIDRRSAAVTRILERRSAVKNLIDYFNPDNNPTITHAPIDVDVEEVRALYGFNESQASAFASIFKVRPLGLLQGPPGTGKTRFIGALIHYALTRGYVRNVLLSSQSHEAVNNAAEAVLKLYPAPLEAPSIIRVGQEGNVSDQLLPFHVARVEQLYKDKFQATVKERLLTAATAIGIPEHLANIFILIEITVRPVVEQINTLAEDTEQEGSLQRIQSLFGTLDSLSFNHDLGIELPNLADLPLEEFEAKIFDAVADRYGCSTELVARFRSIARLTRDIIGSVSTVDRSFETFLAGTRHIVAGTCVGLGRSSLGLTSTVFDLVVIDEAARATAGELAVPMQAGSWVVLVGDQKQLEPRYKENVVSLVADATGFSPSEIIKSDFERVFESSVGREISERITTQYRMLPPIGNVVSNAFYGGDLSPGRNVPQAGSTIFPESLKQPLTWVYTDDLLDKGHQKPEQGKSRKSLTNPKEIELIISMILEWDSHPPFVDWLTNRADPAPAIGIICTYGAQASALKHKLRVVSLSDAMRSTLKIDTVDSYQGKENCIVILSLVRNNADGRLVNGKPTIKPGFMSRPNRINVAVSRAMDKLVIVGARDRWLEGGPMAELRRYFDVEETLGNAVHVEAGKLLEQQRAAQEPSSTSSKISRSKKVVS